MTRGTHMERCASCNHVRGSHFYSRGERGTCSEAGCSCEGFVSRDPNRAGSLGGPPRFSRDDMPAVVASRERGPGIGALTAMLGRMSENQVELLTRVASALDRQGAGAIATLLDASEIVMVPGPLAPRVERALGEPYLSIPRVRR